MITTPLGKIAVTTAGTPVPLSTSPLLCWKVRVQALVGETGKVYLGDTTMTAGTANTGVIKQFWPTGGGGGVADSIEITAPQDSGNVLDLSRFRLDAQVSGEGALVTYWVR
jgi:hypothetical protein